MNVIDKMKEVINQRIWGEPLTPLKRDNELQQLISKIEAKKTKLG